MALRIARLAQPRRICSGWETRAGADGDHKPLMRFTLEDMPVVTRPHIALRTWLQLIMRTRSELSRSKCMDFNAVSRIQKL